MGVHCWTMPEEGERTLVEKLRLVWERFHDESYAWQCQDEIEKYFEENRKHRKARGVEAKLSLEEAKLLLEKDGEKTFEDDFENWIQDFLEIQEVDSGHVEINKVVLE